MGAKIVTHICNPHPDDPTTMVGTGATSIVDTRTLADAQAEAFTRLDLQFQSVIAAGCNYNGKNFQIDPASLQNILGKSTMAMVAESGMATWDPNFQWIATDNTTIALARPQDMVAFGMAIGNYDSAIVLANLALKNAISGLTDVTSCDEFDVTQGWPAN